MKYWKVGLLIAASTLMFGCVSGLEQRATKFTSYDDFAKGPAGGVDLVWARIGLRDAKRLRNKIREYDSVVIDQVFVVTNGDTLDNQQIQELSEFTVARLKQQISPYKMIVEQPTGRTLRLSIALSSVETPNPVLAVTSSVLPVGLAISTISKITTGKHTNVGGASIELLVSDAQNGKALFAAIDKESGNKDFSTMIDSLDDAKDAINYWTERLGVTLTDWQQP